MLSRLTRSLGGGSGRAEREESGERPTTPPRYGYFGRRRASAEAKGGEAKPSSPKETDDAKAPAVAEAKGNAGAAAAAADAKGAADAKVSPSVAEAKAPPDDDDGAPAAPRAPARTSPAPSPEPSLDPPPETPRRRVFPAPRLRARDPAAR